MGAVTITASSLTVHVSSDPMFCSNPALTPLNNRWKWELQFSETGGVAVRILETGIAINGGEVFWHPTSVEESSPFLVETLRDS